MPAAGTRSDTYAAVDLGSNSFHLLVAQLQHGQLQVQDRLRERVVLAEGLSGDLKIGEKAQERGLACLERFGQRVRDMSASQVRAVGTNTLRVARNARAFLAKAEKALGHPIEVVSGREEARLIYLGVAHNVADDAQRRLVVDIGGGSTECILGEGFEPIATDSLLMGCVDYSARFFEGGALTRENLRRAQIAAGIELQSIRRRYRGLGWESAVGSSGTILSIEEILRANGWTRGGITWKGLRKLRRALLEAGSTQELALEGMQPDRAGVLPGGFAILAAVFKSLKIERLQASTGALREGVLYDLAGRSSRDDVRDRTIRAFCQRYAVDLEHAVRVERTALALLEQAAEAWTLPIAEARQLLSWAARLHEIGLSVAYSGYHRHGAYLVSNADMPGFSRDDQAELAALILMHRRKLAEDVFESLPPSRAALALRLCILLRLAVRLNRSRSPKPLPAVRVVARRAALELGFPRDWLEDHPLTRAELDEEAAALGTVGLELVVR